MRVLLPALLAAFAVLVWSATPGATARTFAGDILPAETQAEIEGRGKAFIDAVNSDDDDVRRQILAQIVAPSFIEKVTLDRVVRQAASLRERMGLLEFHHAEISALTRAGGVSRVLHAYARSGALGRWHDLQIRLDGDPPYLLRELAFVAEVSEPVYLPNGDLGDGATREWFNSYIDRLIEQESLSGAVLLAVGDRVLFERYFGFADAAQEEPVEPQTRFNLGSGNKMFTALAVVMLERDGRLSLDDPISKYFPDFPDRAAAERITIAHLLSHTSGIAEYWTGENRPAVEASTGPRDLLALVYKEGMRGEPGEAYRYSNSNFVLAGLIVEAASGRPYDEFVRERITGPLGLKNTDTFAMDGSVPRLADRLSRGEGRTWVPAPAAPAGRRGGPAGGGFSTPRDMFVFARALVDGKVVTKETLARMTTSQTPAATRAEDDDYGFGFMLGSSGDQRFFGHGGIARGVNFELRCYPALDATLITFSNQDNGAYDDLRRTAAKLLTGVR